MRETIVFFQNPVTKVICWKVLQRIIVIALCSAWSSTSLQRTKHASSGKRRKRKVKKSLYGEREMASKKPLLSPIPEIPEVLSSASSPSSPKANALPGNVFVVLFCLTHSFCFSSYLQCC